MVMHARGWHATACAGRWACVLGGPCSPIQTGTSVWAAKNKMIRVMRSPKSDVHRILFLRFPPEEKRKMNVWVSENLEATKPHSEAEWNFGTIWVLVGGGSGSQIFSLACCTMTAALCPQPQFRTFIMNPIGDFVFWKHWMKIPSHPWQCA